VLIFNILGSSRLDRFVVSAEERSEGATPPQPVRDRSMRGAALDEAALSSATTTPQTARDQALHSFNLGLLSLEHTAGCGAAPTGHLRAHPRLAAASSSRPLISSRSWRCASASTSVNFLSLFQSLPDSWAIDQVFSDHADPPLAQRPVQRRAR